MKPSLPTITLLAVDTTDKPHLAARAISKSLEQCDFGAVKLLTHDTTLPNAVRIDRLWGLEGYSRFCIRDLHRFVETPHCVLVQYDGYVVRGEAWTDEFLNYDYIGSPFNPSQTVGNGGFSLRSRKLLQACSTLPTGNDEHPEDAWISIRHRRELEMKGIKIPAAALASRFAFEGRSFDRTEWASIPNLWNGSFGFHSWLSLLPDEIDKPLIFHHSGDLGDVVYALGCIKALGGGVLFLSADNRHPYPWPTRWQRAGGRPDWSDSVRSLANVQPYIWNTIYTHATPHSTDIDFNKFRDSYRSANPDNFGNLYRLHQKVCGLNLPEDEPWLVADKPQPIPGRPIIINRTERYHNWKFPWYELVRKYRDQMMFVGTPTEHELFHGLFADKDRPPIKIPYQPTANLLELARIIAGAKVVIANQSCAMAIALGLGKNVIQEVWPGNPNCILRRDNAIYITDQSVDIPGRWLQ